MTSEPSKQLTVRELIDKLQALLDAGCPPDALVETEGCDCTGEAGDVSVYDFNDLVRTADGSGVEKRVGKRVTIDRVL